MTAVSDVFEIHRPPMVSRDTQRRLLGEYDNNIAAWGKGFNAARRQLPKSLPNYRGRVGIEIEVERIAQMIDIGATANPPTWEIKGDGSLRNGGVEFVSHALTNEQVLDSIASVYAWFAVNKAAPDFSWRTSVHVHLDVRHLTLSQLQNLLLLYILFEEALFEFASPDRREQNIFCTPLTRTHYESLSMLLNEGSARDRDTFLRAWRVCAGAFGKYSALNINHISDFGTVEFRHLRGDTSPSQLGDWTALIMQLGKAASEVDREWINQNIKELNTTSDYRRFSEEIFGNILIGGLIHRPFQRQLSDGVTVAKQIIAGGMPPIRKASKDAGIDAFSEYYTKKLLPDRLAQKEKSRGGDERAIPEEIAQHGDWLRVGPTGTLTGRHNPQPAPTAEDLDRVREMIINMTHRNIR